MKTTISMLKGTDSKFAGPKCLSVTLVMTFCLKTKAYKCKTDTSQEIISFRPVALRKAQTYLVSLLHLS